MLRGIRTVEITITEILHDDANIEAAVGLLLRKAKHLSDIRAAVVAAETHFQEYKYKKERMK